MASMFVFGSFSYIKSYLLWCGQKRNMMELFCEPKAVMTGWVFWIASWVISVTRLFTVFCLSCHPLLPHHSKKLYTSPTARVPGLITQRGHLSPPPQTAHDWETVPRSEGVWKTKQNGRFNLEQQPLISQLHSMRRLYLDLLTDHKLKPPFT